MRKNWQIKNTGKVKGLERQSNRYEKNREGKNTILFVKSLKELLNHRVRLK